MPIDASFKIYVSYTRLMWNPDMATKREFRNEVAIGYLIPRLILSSLTVDFK